MKISNLLVANRGEVAIRIMRAAADMGVMTTAIYAADDAESLHTQIADCALALDGSGAAPYLDIGRIIGLAKKSGCDAIHPGYGFLSEDADFARACEADGIVFVGPAPPTLDLFGDKSAARILARNAGVPVLPGTEGPASLEDAKAFLSSLGEGGGAMIKALAGGGGRGMRPVLDQSELEEAYALCRSEAMAAFGKGEVYLEALIARARHIEVQIAGDGSGACVHFGERDCSIQRRRQKLIEIAPAPNLSADMREALTDAAVHLASTAKYANIGTVEFLVTDDEFYFIETNARLQVEHTVTEEVFGIDLVRLQLNLAAGRTLAELGLTQDAIAAPRGCAVQLRVNMETMSADGDIRPSSGTLGEFAIPSGPGIRTDSFGYAGYRTSARFDSLLAKLIVHSPSPDLADAMHKAYRALSEFKISGVSTNIPFLQSLLKHPEILAGRGHTNFVETNMADLLAGMDHPKRLTRICDCNAPFKSGN